MKRAPRPVAELIECEVKRWETQELTATGVRPTPRPVITISRALGAGGEDVAVGLAQLTGFRLLDAEMLDGIAVDLGVQSRLVERFDEALRDEIEVWVRGVLAGRVVHPTDYLRSLTRVVCTIATYGCAIIVGRGANYILGPERAFRLRIVAPLERRIASFAERFGLNVSDAKKAIWENDAEKAAFVDKTFNRDINDPLAYDLVINNEGLGLRDVVELALLAYGKKEHGLRR